MDFATLARDWGPWVALVCVLIWSQRESLMSLFSRKATIGIKREETELNAYGQLLQAAIDKIGGNGTDKTWELVERTLRQTEIEREERRAASARLIEYSHTSQQTAAQAVEVMKDFADIARAMVDRQVPRETLEAIGFVLTAIYFGERKGKTFSDLIIEMRGPNGE